MAAETHSGLQTFVPKDGTAPNLRRRFPWGDASSPETTSAFAHAAAEADAWGELDGGASTWVRPRHGDGAWASLGVSLDSRAIGWLSGNGAVL